MCPSQANQHHSELVLFFVWCALPVKRTRACTKRERHTHTQTYIHIHTCIHISMHGCLHTSILMTWRDIAWHHIPLHDMTVHYITYVTWHCITHNILHTRYYTYTYFMLRITHCIIPFLYITCTLNTNTYTYTNTYRNTYIHIYIYMFNAYCNQQWLSKYIRSMLWFHASLPPATLQKNNAGLHPREWVESLR